MVILVLCVLSKMTVAQQSDASIGSVTELNGIGRIVRDKPYDAALSFDIESYDNVETSNGRIGITFLNDTRVRLTEHSQLVIDEFIYDPSAPSTSKLVMNIAAGTVRYAPKPRLLIRQVPQRRSHRAWHCRFHHSRRPQWASQTA